MLAKCIKMLRASFSKLDPKENNNFERIEKLSYFFWENIKEKWNI